MKKKYLFFTSSVVFGHQFYLTEEGRLMASGNNSYGQLCIGHKGGGYPKDEEVSFFWEKKEKVLKVALGCNHTVFLTDKQAYTVGYNGNGQLCTGDRKNKSFPQNIKTRSNGRIINVFAGSGNTVLITDKENEILAGGRNNCGQNGNGSFSDNYTAVVMCFYDPVKDIVTGCDYTCMLSTDGSVYKTGKINYEKKCSIPIKLNGDIEFEKIISLEGGTNSILMINKSKEIFVVGRGGPQVGMTKKKIDHPEKVESLSKINSIIDVKTGSMVTYVLNSMGDLYGVGSGSKELLSDHTELSYYNPVLVKQNVSAVFCGKYRSFIVMRNGKVFLSGCSVPKGELGTSGNTPWKHATSVKNLKIEYFITSIQNLLNQIHNYNYIDIVIKVY